MNETILAIVLVFATVAAVAFVVSRLLIGDNGDSKLRDRLNAKTEQEQSQIPQQRKGVAPMLQKVGQAAAAPFMPNTREKQSSLRKQLGFAGIYSPSAVKVMTGFKVILLAGGLIGGYVTGLATHQMMLPLSIGG